MAVACIQVGLSSDARLEADAEQALTALESADPPLSAVAALCRDLAAGRIPATAEQLPADLPAALRPLFAQLVEAVAEARASSG